MMKRIKETDRSLIDTLSMKVSAMLRSIVKFQVRVTGFLGDRRDRGATAVEYGLMVALIAVVIIVTVTMLGKQLSSLFGGVTSQLPTP